MEFPVVKLIDYQNEIQELEKDKNPFSLVVLAHLKLIEAGKDNEKKFDAKLALIKMLLKKGLDKTSIKELLIFVDWILQLPEKLEIKFDEELEKIQEDKLMSYVTTWERRAEKKGKIEGKIEGKIAGKIEGKIETAKKMILDGLSRDKIIKYTGLSEKEIDKLKKEM